VCILTRVQPKEATELQEIKDPALIFDRVWKKLEAKYSREMMRFPKEMIFLMGMSGLDTCHCT